jgi:UDPglucose 6-dehydrogenase
MTLSTIGTGYVGLVTEWKPFRRSGFETMGSLMRMPIVFDGRNQYDSAQVRALGFEYFGIGR